MSLVKRVRSDILVHRYFYISAALLLLILLLPLHSRREGTDPKHYLAWTRSLFFDGDILLINDLEAAGAGVLLTPTGYAVELANVGPALWWLPFYALAHGLILLTQGSLLASRTTGVEPPYLLAINLSSCIYGSLGLLLSYLTAARYFSKKASIWAVGLVSLGTPLFYYTTSLPMNPHIPSFFLTALFVYLWSRYRETYNWKRCFTLGVMAGWLALLANYNVVVTVLPLTDWLVWLFRYRPRLSWLQWSVTYGLGAILAFAPQLIVWNALYGSPFYTPYAQALFWFRPHILETLFSPFHGLFIYAPLLLLSVAGFFLLMSKDRWLGLSFALAFSFLTYVNAVNLSWWAGSSFGARIFLVLTPIFIVGLAALLDHRSHWALYLVGVVCAAWTFLLFLQTVGGLINLHNFYPLGTLVRGQWQSLVRFPELMLTYLASFSSDGPVILIGCLWVLALIGMRLVYGLATADRIIGGRYVFGSVVVLPVALILCFALATWRGNQAREQLRQSGFYDGSRLVTTFNVYALAGLYQKRAEYNLALGRQLEATQDVYAAAEIWPSRSRLLISAGDLDRMVQHRVDLNYSNIMRLVGYRIESVPIRVGDTLQVRLFWERLAGHADTASSAVQLLDPQGHILGQGTIAEGAEPLPADLILDGMRFYDTVPIALGVDVSSPTLAHIHVSLPEDSGPPLASTGAPHDGVIGLVEVLPSNFAGATAFEPTRFNLGGQVILAGYSLSQSRVSPGDTLRLALTWQAEQAMKNDYTVFVHLIDETGAIYAQDDSQPVDGTRSTTYWQAGETILDEYALSLPADLSSGRYRIEVGMYLLSTGERLMLLNDQGYVVDSRVNLVGVVVQ